MAPECARNFSLLSYWEYLYLCSVLRPQGKVGGPKVGVHPRVAKNYINFIRRGWIIPLPKDV